MKNIILAMPPKPEVTRLQVSTLLAILNNLESFIVPMRLHNGGSDDEGKPGTVSDGGALLAAEASFVRALDTLDRLLADPARWDLAQTDRLEAIAMFSLAKQGAPHARLRPQITAMEDGTFVASHGTDPESLIYGIGKTVEEALTDFDRQCNVTTTQIRKVQVAPPAPEWELPEAPPKPAKKRKKSK